jgi:RNA polymerase sigma factor (sigma-70 family)
MAARHMDEVIKRLSRAVIVRDGASLADSHLLNCFIADRDEAAFEALVRRHGPMVWGVCRRILFNIQDAEDAFQATFLILIRKAESIVPREMVANWLYGVAYKTALKTRAMTAKRSVKEKQVVHMPEITAGPPERVHDWQPVLDYEVNRLNSKYRAAVVLCDLEGKTRREAARQLGVPEGTLSARLDRARKTLAKRLTRQGVAFTGASLAVALAHNAASASVPALVVSSTIRAASVLMSGPVVAKSAISIKVLTLTEGVIQAMFLSKLKMALAVVLTLSLIGTAGFYGSSSASDKEGEQEGAASAQPDPKRQPESNQSLERRLAQVEKQVARLLNEVNDLKAELKRKGAPIGKGPGTGTEKVAPEGVKTSRPPESVTRSSVGEKFGTSVEKGAPADKDDQIRVFHLKYAQSGSALQILQELFAAKGKHVRMVGDPRTNSIFVVSDDRTTEELQAVLSKIDVPEEKPDSPKK